MIKLKRVEFFGSFFQLRDIPYIPLPKIIFSGRSNVGKSSMINTLLNIKDIARVGKRPGKTRSVNFIMINKEFFFVDLPGYGYAGVSKKMKNLWGNLIEGFLNREKYIKGAFILMDIRRDPEEEEFMLMDFLKGKEIPFIIVLTKCDKLGKNDRLKRIKRISEKLSMEASFIVPFSSKTKEGKDEVWKYIKTMIEGV